MSTKATKSDRARATSKSKLAKRRKKAADKRSSDGPAFVRWFTHPKTGKRLVAKDYGYKAWPLRTPRRSEES